MAISTRKKILIIERDKSVRGKLNKRLTQLGYILCFATTGKAALSVFKNEQPHLVIVDLILYHLDGYEVCRRIRKNSTVPIILLSSIKKITNRVLGLELGADDYLIKPFSGKELEIKISSILRRTLKTESFEDKLPVRIKDLTFSKINKEVFRDGKKVNLTSMELSLLELLIENAGVTLSRTSILNNVWGYKPERAIDTRLVDLYIFRLRSKLKLNGQYPDYISTVRGIGYVFQKK